MATVNFADLLNTAEEAPDFTPIPPGPYPVQVESAEVKNTKTGKIMFALTLVVTSGDHQKRKLWTNLVVSPESPQAMGFFFRDMAVLGADQEFFKGNPDPADIAAKVIGANAVARVDFQKNDPTRNEVKGFSASSTASAVASAASPASTAPASAAPKSPF